MTTYDGADFVERQLASVLAQTELPAELLVGDDGSSDGTVGLVRAVLADAPMSWDVRRNPVRLGVTGNLEALLRRATGDVIFLADQDDEWVPEKVEVVLAAFEARPEIQGVFTDAGLIDARSDPLPGSLWEAVGFDERRRRRWEVDPFGVLMRDNVVTGAAMAIRRTALTDVLPLSARGWHDYWIATLLARRRALMPIDRQLIRYRVHQRNQAGLPPRAIERMRSVRGDAGRWTAHRLQLEDLLVRIEERGDRPPAGLLERIDHIAFREHLSARRLERIAALLLRIPRRDYWRFSSGWRSLAIDVLVPPSSSPARTE